MRSLAFLLISTVSELAFATSLGAEDQMITYYLSQVSKEVKDIHTGYRPLISGNP